MQAIITKYHGPGNVRGSRVSAHAQAGRIYLDWDDALNKEENHKLAARLFAQKFSWPYARLVTGYLPSGDYVHVFKE